MLAVLCVGSAQAATPLDDIRAFQIAWREEAAEVELATKVLGNAPVRKPDL